MAVLALSLSMVADPRTAVVLLSCVVVSAYGSGTRIQLGVGRRIGGGRRKHGSQIRSAGLACCVCCDAPAEWRRRAPCLPLCRLGDEPGDARLGLLQSPRCVNEL